MADAPELAAMPPLRCAHVVENSREIFCGKIATHMIASSAHEGSRFVCREHADDRAVPIVGEQSIRVVRLHVEVTFAGVIPIPGPAQLEAVERLIGAVEAVGGLVNLIGVASRQARGGGPAPSGGQKGYLGDLG